MPAAKVAAFFHHFGRTGSVTLAADRAQLRRSSLYQRRQDDEAFVERWAQALDLGVERLQDNALNRARNGTERAASCASGGRVMTEITLRWMQQWRIAWR